MAKLANFVGFQLGWWACILGAAEGRPWVGPVVVGAVIAGHIAWTRRRGEVALVLFAVLLGLVLDGGLTGAGVLVFEAEDGPFVGPLPLWMVALWANFAPTLGHSMGWMRGRYVVGAVFGGVGGPLSYWAGESFGALAFGAELGVSLAAVAGVWAVAMPVLLLVTERVMGGGAGLKGSEET